MPPRSLVKLFLTHLRNDKNSSDNTLQAYSSDISLFYQYIKNDSSVINATADDIENFKLHLKNDGRAVSSVSRVLSSVRTFYGFLLKSGYISENPAKHVKNDKAAKKDFDVLSYEEVDKLINQPCENDEKAIRDKAILEILYATGMKVSELTALDISDFNYSLSYIKCGDGKAKRLRTIPLYPKAKRILFKYISESRKFLISDLSETALFVNINGTRMTRQGLWKIIKSYANDAGILKDITPKALRHSFAMHLLENGADVKQLKDILGHADISTTNIYVEFLKKNTSNTLISLHPHA